jgi:hypothetical protein
MNLAFAPLIHSFVRSFSKIGVRNKGFGARAVNQLPVRVTPFG